MSQENKQPQDDRRPPPEAEAQSECPSQPAPAGGPEAASAQAQPPAASAANDVAALHQEIAELRDKNLRLLAELQNQQKRFMREREEALRYAEAELARELLVVLDDLERTLAAATNTPDVATLTDGVRIVYEHFLKVLKRCHIEPIEAVGRPFDPAFHEALLQQPSAEYPAGTVVAELARGYRMRERLLRPSRVIVSSGAPPAPGAEATPTGNPDSEKEER